MAIEEFLARKYLWIDGNASPFFYRFSKRCQLFSQNGTERNDNNYGKKITVLWPYYRTEFETFFWLLLIYKS